MTSKIVAPFSWSSGIHRPEFATMSQPAPKPGTAPIAAAARLYTAPSSRVVITSPALVNPRALRTARCGRRSSASASARFTTRAMPARTMIELRAKLMGAFCAASFSISLTSSAFAVTTWMCTSDGISLRAAATAGAICWLFSNSCRPSPKAESRTTLICEVPVNLDIAGSVAKTAGCAP